MTVKAIARMLVATTVVLNGAGIAQTPAFDIKGYTVGVEISSVDKAGCRSSANVDSGMPGFVCDTTLAGEKAELKLAVFEGKVAAIVASVKNASMTPVLDALSEKFGRPSQMNRYIEDYHWRNGEQFMFLNKKRLDNGYDVMILDNALLEKQKASRAAKAKKDI